MRESLKEAYKANSKNTKRFFEACDLLLCSDASVDKKRELARDLLFGNNKILKIENTYNFGALVCFYYQEFLSRGLTITRINFLLDEDPRGRYSEDFYYIGSFDSLIEKIDFLGGIVSSFWHDGREYKVDILNPIGVFSVEDGKAINGGDFYKKTGFDILDLF